MKTTTENMTQEELVRQTDIPAKLVAAVIEQFGGWEDFTQSAPDVCRGGIDGGFNGFIYTKDCEDLARSNRKEIAKLASEQAADFGCALFEMIKEFGCFRHNAEKPTDEEIGQALYSGNQVDDGYGVLNALAWYAGEEVCREYCRLTDQE
jgi:hypothetical protein